MIIVLIVLVLWLIFFEEWSYCCDIIFLFALCNSFLILIIA